MWTYCSVLLFVAGVYCDKSVTVGNITTMVMGQSGKISIYKGENKSDGVTVTFDAIEEIDTDGAKIQSHSYQNFAQLDFTFSEPKNDTYPNSNVSVTQFDFTATMNIDSNTATTLTSYVYIFTSDGNITVDGDETEVKNGDMKFNAEIKDWPFCKTCRKGNKDLTGQYLDFSVEIKGKKEPNKTDSDSSQFYLGGGASVVTPKEVIYFNGSTNTTENMPSGYPKLETKGSKQIFIFRFKSFDDKVLYDPIVTLGSEDGSDDTNGDDRDGGDTDKEVAAAGIKAKILGKSGKMTITSKGAADNSDNRITVEFRNLNEKKMDGSDIQESSHGINSFASQGFTFSSVMNENYPGTTIAVSKVTFESALKNGATLKVHFYVFKAGGNITQDDETMAVQKGNAKFNIEINSWSFCSNTVSCKQNEIGAYLDFDVIIKGKGNAKKESGSENKYSLGTGDVLFSKKVKVDGVYVNMSGGYPMDMMKGSMQIFRFRFPKFTTSILYDPVLDLMTDDDPSSASKITYSSILIAALCYVFHML